MPRDGRTVLILGGTGAMGVSLVKIMADQGWNVFVTSRQDRQSDRENISYIKGNAKQLDFLTEVLKRHYDAIVDFMSYSTGEFENRVDLLLRSTDQYIFLSSARVYAESNVPLTENSPRLLDVCEDAEYLATDEYALAKARQEDILQSKKTGCYTIVRPSLTYNTNRLQLVISEKEEWLYRALHNRKIVLPEDVMEVQTTMTWGSDVATGIAGLIGNERAYGETVHIASSDSLTWNDVLETYQQVLEKRTGERADIYYVPSALKVAKKLNRYYQIKYARSINRRFDNSKITNLVEGITFVSPEEGLKKCLEEFLDNPQFGNISVKAQAYFDHITGDRMDRTVMDSFTKKAKYFIYKDFLA